MGNFNNVTYGEKIGFSRADLAEHSKLFQALCQTDQEKAATKDAVWKRIDAVKAVAESGNQALIYWKKLVRDCINPRPDFQWYGQVNEKTDVLELYIREVSRIRDAVMESGTINRICMDGQEWDLWNWVKLRFTDSRKGRIYFNQLGQMVWSPGIANVAQMRPVEIINTARLKKYGLTKEDAAKEDAFSRIRIYPYIGVFASRPDGQAVPKDTKAAYICQGRVIGKESGAHIAMTMAQPDGFHPVKGSYILMDSIRYTVENYPDEISATARQNELASDYAVRECDKKKTERKKKFSYTTVAVVQKNGYMAAKDYGGEDFLKEFHFRGLEFGNWLNENDRQQSMNAAFVSFENLAGLLSIAPASLSFGRKMSVAFGSRGKGNAAAHYEPGTTDVINLTKLSGAGCVAHEWGHALDRHIADYLHLKSGTMATESSFRVLPEPVKKIVLRLSNPNTKYYQDSYKFGTVTAKSGNGYWDSRCEMFARAFDCYILDKLRKAGIIDTYLCAYAESYVAEVRGIKACAFPTGREREVLNEYFRELVQWCKEANILQ